MVIQTVSENLWKLYQPEPASEEEQALEAKQKEALQLEKEREKVFALPAQIYNHAYNPISTA